MSKFDSLYNSLTEAIPVTSPTSTLAAATQPVTNQPSTYNQQTVPKPTTTPTTPATAQKIDANNPVVQELVAAKDPTQVITALQKLGLK
jgi:hypothetical protein